MSRKVFGYPKDSITVANLITYIGSKQLQTER